MILARRAHLLASFAALTVALWASMAQATAPLTLTHETRVSIRLRLTYQRPAAEPLVIEETLRGPAGQTLAFAHDFSVGGSPLIAAITIIAQPEADGGMAQLLLDSEVHAGGEPIRVKRDLNVSSGRLMLVDIWSDPERDERLVLTLSTRWEEIPQLQTLRPGAEPVDLILEVLEWNGNTYRSIEKNRLGSIIGEAVTYTFQRRAGLVENAIPTSRLAVELHPESIKKGELFLRVHIRGEQTEGQQAGPAVDTSLGQALSPGFALDIPLPGPAGQPGLIFRVTPYF